MDPTISTNMSFGLRKSVTIVFLDWNIDGSEKQGSISVVWIINFYLEADQQKGSISEMNPQFHLPDYSTEMEPYYPNSWDRTFQFGDIDFDEYVVLIA